MANGFIQKWLDAQIDAINDRKYSDDFYIFATFLNELQVTNLEKLAKSLDLEIKEDFETYKDDEDVEKVIRVEYRGCVLKELIMKGETDE